MTKYCLLLHNIRSNHNVGSIFRTADAAGISKIYLTGYSAAPLDRFKREVKEISKTALGAEKNIPWEQCKSALTLIKNLKKDGFKIIAIEQDKRAKDYKKIKPNKKTVFVLGNEINGLEKKVLDLCDEIAEIPMKGQKESLNVSVSAGIALFRILNI
ncbi:MAG TPA: TrmH family RNA methyltransferase [Candidatus Paceibacterota bacterium]|nr:TrmH family RNA methyltransferase [Candidatus Paceibacterota bacterium]